MRDGLVWRAKASGALVLLALAVSGCFEEKAKPAAPPLPEALVMKPVRKDVPIYSEWVGTLDGLVDAKITAQVTGYLWSQDYKEGTYVKKGAPLFTIDPRPFQAALDQAKGQWAQAVAQQKLSEITQNRLAPLAKDNVVSQQDYDNARLQNAANIAAVQAAKANVDKAKINLDFTKITSPVDGIAGIRQANIGDLVGPQGNVTTLTQVSQVNPIYAAFPISEVEYLKAAKILNDFDPTTARGPQKKLQLFLSDDSVWPQPGTFSFADRQVTVSTGTILLKALFPNPDNVLRPGQYARVRAVVAEKKDALLVPQRAVQQIQGTYSLVTVGADHKVVVKTVTVGDKVGQMWVIEQGITDSDDVVVEGIQRLKTGMPVNPRPFTQTAPAPATDPGADKAVDNKPAKPAGK